MYYVFAYTLDADGDIESIVAVRTVPGVDTALGHARTIREHWRWTLGSLGFHRIFVNITTRNPDDAEHEDDLDIID